MGACRFTRSLAVFSSVASYGGGWAGVAGGRACGQGAEDGSFEQEKVEGQHFVSQVRTNLICLAHLKSIFVKKPAPHALK